MTTFDASKTYTSRDARSWDRALREKDAEIARLRAALKPFAEYERTNKLAHDSDPVALTMGELRAALKMLENP